jgi:TonB family protein
MRLVLTFFFLACLFNFADGQELIGKVIDKDNKEPVADVELQIVGRSVSTNTNQKGDFRLFISLGYPCLVEFSKEGYQSHVLNLKVDPEEDVILELATSNIKQEPQVLQDLQTYDPLDVDSKPVYPGCELKETEAEKFDCFEVAVSKHISKNVNYPKAAKKKKLEETVTVGFEINFDGKVTGVEILKGRYNELNKEAMRVVWSLPIMKPAIKNHQKVKMSYQVPVKFKLK